MTATTSLSSKSSVGPCSSCTLYMYDLSPTWKPSTIALLINKELVQDPTIPLETGQGRIRVIQIHATGIDATTAACISFNKNKNNNNKANKRNGNTKMIVAELELASLAEISLLETCYQGLPVPNTHGYHHYTFHNTLWTQEKSDEEIQEEQREMIKDEHNTIISVPSPPLHLQLMAVPTKELEKRLSNRLSEWNDVKFENNGLVAHKNDVHRNKNNTVKKIKCKVRRHCYLVYQLCKVLGPSRTTLFQPGVPVPTNWTDRLLQALRNIPTALELTTANVANNQKNNSHHTSNKEQILSWPPTHKQRRGVRSSNYLTVRKQHPPYQDELWQLCYNLIYATLDQSNETPTATTIPNYNALAVTKNFIGSPHIDAQDQSFQYVIAVGNFHGGYLCCEYDDNHYDNDILQIDIYNKLGRMDGRKVHWVSSWHGMDRYSIVYYTTRMEDWTDPTIPQQAHVDWMKRSISAIKEKNSRMNE